MINFNEVKELVINLGFESNPESLSPNTNLYHDLNLDSTEMADLCAMVKKKFKVIVQKDQYKTLGDLCNLISQGC